MVLVFASVKSYAQKVVRVESKKLFKNGTFALSRSIFDGKDTTYHLAYLNLKYPRLNDWSSNSLSKKDLLEVYNSIDTLMNNKGTYKKDGLLILTNSHLTFSWNKMSLHEYEILVTDKLSKYYNLTERIQRKIQESIKEELF